MMFLNWECPAISSFLGRLFWALILGVLILGVLILGVRFLESPDPGTAAACSTAMRQRRSQI
jgi:hypothetical protein